MYVIFRLTMEIGGADITRTFIELLSILGFNPGIDSSLYSDAILSQELKERLCHLDHVRNIVYMGADARKSDN